MWGFWYPSPESLSEIAGFVLGFFLFITILGDLILFIAAIAAIVGAIVILAMKRLLKGALRRFAVAFVVGFFLPLPFLILAGAAG